MPRYEYPCPSCGKPVRGYYRGTARDAERYGAWRAQRGAVCEACFAAQADAENRAAAADPLNDVLPPLQGSEKQIAWGTRCRLDILPQIQSARDEEVAWITQRVAAEQFSQLAVDELIDATCLIAAEWIEETDAGEWIDRRNWGPQSIRNRIAEHRSRRLKLLCPTAYAEIKARTRAGESRGS